jgi:acyl-CoA synthetase (AMP-forming)/AMP-acid ligase II
MVSGWYVGEPAHLPSEWLRTGDFGKLDEEGRLTVIGRSDDIIISGGENIHPVEVEGVLLTHPAVDEVAVVGLPDPEWGEIVVAAVVATGDTNVRDLEAFVREHLAGYKVPRRWRFVETLPRNAIGKLSRQEIVDSFDREDPGR